MERNSETGPRGDLAYVHRDLACVRASMRGGPVCACMHSWGPGACTHGDPMRVHAWGLGTSTDGDPACLRGGPGACVCGILRARWGPGARVGGSGMCVHAWGSGVRMGIQQAQITSFHLVIGLVAIGGLILPIN